MWSSVYREWLLKVMFALCSFCLYLFEVNNALTTSEFSIPTWKEYWDDGFMNLNLLISSNHSAFLVDSKVNLSTSRWLPVFVPTKVSGKFIAKIHKSTKHGHSSHVYVIMLTEEYQLLENSESQSTRNASSKKWRNYFQPNHSGLTNETVPAELTENWMNHSQIMTLVHSDAHTVVYYDSAMDPSLEWPFKLLSDSWSYAKATFGNFSLDPILYVFLHNVDQDGPKGCFGSKDQSYYHSIFKHLTVIDCAIGDADWKDEEPLHASHILGRQIGLMVLSAAKQTGTYPAKKVSEYALAEVITFDILNRVSDFITTIIFFEGVQANVYNTPHPNVHWIRRWYYVLYLNYGKASVLNSFFNLLDEKFPKSIEGHDYARDLNVGEYIHFWSGAAKVNLKGFAKFTLNWTIEYERQWTSAVLDFPGITYKDETKQEMTDSTAFLLKETEFTHRRLLTRKYADSNVNVYWDADVKPPAIWTFKFLSRGWHHIISNYNTVKRLGDPTPNVLLHARGYEGCRTHSKRDKNRTKSLIDCGSRLRTAWTNMSQEATDTLLNVFATLIQQSANQTEFTMLSSQTPFKQMLMFDMYIALQLFEEAFELLSLAFSEKDAQSVDEKFLIRDWLLPIYNNYGGVHVLGEFLSLSLEHWNQRKNSKSSKMNTGERIHFWSAAAGENLLPLAYKAFGQRALDQKQLDGAKNDFLLLLYNCYYCYYEVFRTSDSTGGALVTGITTSFAVGIFAVVIVLLFLYQRKINILKIQLRELTFDEVRDFFEGNSSAVEEDGMASIESNPFNMAYELHRDQLEIDLDKVLGSGEFGLVLQGTLKQSPGAVAGENTLVAVKTVKPNVDVFCFKAMLTELKVMCFLGVHPNIASLLGACTANIKNREVYIAIEFCAQGDLLEFLKKHRDNFKNLFPKKRQPASNYGNAFNANSIIKEASIYANAEANNKAVEITTLDLLEWSSQIAHGMAYIAHKKVIHGDLAARNILLTAENVAKISDFGLSRQLLNYSNYMKTTKTPLPWRWMAIESLRDMNFSVQSDVWAFGVTLYEIFSIGTMPYPGWTWDYDFIDRLVAGDRLSEPEFGNQEIYCIMLDCMKSNPKDRPAIASVIDRFEAIKANVSAPSVGHRNYDNITSNQPP